MPELRARVFLLAALALASVSEAQTKTEEPGAERAFKLAQRLDCRGGGDPAFASLPKNALVMIFDDESKFGEPFKWVVREKAALMRSVEQLLRRYGFALSVREMSSDAARAAFYGGGNSDVALDYQSNTFAVRVTESCSTMGSTTVFPLCDENDGCYDGDEVYGPDSRHYAADSCVQSVGSFGVDGLPGERARLRAYMAAIIVHEVVHAAHARLLGNLMASPPTSVPRDCPVWVPLSQAQAKTRALRQKLGIPSAALHMAHGLMTPGISLDGNPRDHAGGGSPNLAQCLADKRLAPELFADVGALARSSALCTEYDKPVSEFFSLPAENVRLIKLHLESRRAVPCHSACYYALTKEKVRLDR